MEHSVGCYILCRDQSRSDLKELYFVDYDPVLEPSDETLEFPELDGLVIPDPNEQLVITLNRSSTCLAANVL